MFRELIVGVATAIVFTAPALGEAATFPVDPVELVHGNEVPGADDISAEHYRYRYVFANEKNRSAFEQDPARYEIQLGGACARMGPLSGVGKMHLYAVHEQRIYVFASEACRATFLKDPAGVLEADDARPTDDDPQSRARGIALIERAVRSVGGANALDAVSSYEERVDREVEYEGERVHQSKGLTIGFPDRVERKQTWDDLKWIAAVAGDRGWFESSSGIRDMHAQQRRALTRLASRNLLTILRARTRPDFLAVDAGSAMVDGAIIDRVAVYFDGNLCTLGIHAETGRVVTQSYRGRGPSMRIGLIERHFSDFETIDGITLPRTITSRFDGESTPDSRVTFTHLRVASRG